MIKIRHAKLEDLESITEIYNDAILKTTATFDTEQKTVEEQKSWFAQHGPKYPILVAEADGSVAGWGSLSKWSDRCAYADTAEISLYVAEHYQGKGVGKKLMQAIMDEGRKVGHHSILSRIAEGNDASVRLHESFGFEHVGIMKEVGRKFGKLLDVFLMQKIYEEPSEGNDTGA
jgi:L-amino acid N-acyltransferase YncA